MSATPDDRTLPRVRCTHCTCRIGIPDKELSSDSEDMASSGSSSTDDTEDSDDARPQRTLSMSKQTRDSKKAGTLNKGRRNDDADKIQLEGQRPTRAIIPGKTEGGPNTPTWRNAMRQNAKKETSPMRHYAHAGLGHQKDAPRARSE